MSTTAGSNDKSTTFNKSKGSGSSNSGSKQQQVIITNQIWHLIRKSGTPLLGSVFDRNKLSFMTSGSSSNRNNNKDLALEVYY